MNILILGQADAAEMATARAVLESGNAAIDIIRKCDISSAMSHCKTTDSIPELVVVFLEWPDQFPRDQVEQLIGLLPLARWVVCCGAWCESIGRNSLVWPTAIRVPARDGDIRIAREIDVIQGKRNSLPLTASREEAYAYDNSPCPLHVGSKFAVEVRSPDQAYQQSILDILRRHNLASMDSPQPAGPDVIIWDLDPYDSGTFNRVRACCAADNIPIIGTMGVVYPEDLQALTSIGVLDVISKLAPAERLVRLLLDLQGPINSLAAG